MHRIKLLAVDQDAIAPHGRGVYREVQRYGNVEVVLVVPAVWKNDFGRTRFDGGEEPSLRLCSRRTLFTGKSHRALYPGLSRLLLKEQPDIFYINAEPESYLAWQSVIARRASSPGTKIIFMSWRNIDYPPGDFPYRLAFLNARAEHAVLSEADHCVARNESAKRIFDAKGFHNVTVIPPAIEMDVFSKRNTEGTKARYSLRSFTIGYAGRFVSEKGLDVLLQAAALLDFDHQILLIGDGPAKRGLMQLASDLGIERRIIWCGPIHQSELPSALCAMDILVLPSRTGTSWKEQFGRILIEAMACGVPVIGSSSGEIPNVIGGSGLVFEEGNPQALAVGLQRIFADHHLRIELSSSGIERVMSTYAVPVVARQYHSLFMNLANARE